MLGNMLRNMTNKKTDILESYSDYMNNPAKERIVYYMKKEAEKGNNILWIDSSYIYDDEDQLAFILRHKRHLKLDDIKVKYSCGPNGYRKYYLKW